MKARPKAKTENTPIGVTPEFSAEWWEGTWNHYGWDFPMEYARYFKQPNDLQHFLDFGIHFFRKEDPKIPARFRLIVQHWVSAFRCPKTDKNRKAALEINPTRGKASRLVSEALNYVLRKEKHPLEIYPTIYTNDSGHLSPGVSLLNIEEAKDAITDLITQAITAGDAGFFRAITDEMNRRQRAGKQMLTDAKLLRQRRTPPSPQSKCLQFLQNFPVLEKMDWPNYLEGKVFLNANGTGIALAIWVGSQEQKDPHYKRLGLILQVYEILSHSQRRIPNETQLRSYFNFDELPDSKWAESLKYLGLSFLKVPKKKGRPASKYRPRRKS